MSGYSSRHGTIAIAKQTGLGSPAAAPTVKFHAMGRPSLVPIKTRAPYPMTDGGRDAHKSYTSLMTVGGDIPLGLHFDGFGLLAYLALGANADAGGPTDYTHTGTPANDVPFCTIWRMVAGVVVERYHDCKVNSLRLEAAAGGYWTVTLGVMGVKSEFLAADTGLAALTSDPLLYAEAKDNLKFDAVAQHPHRVSLEITNGLAGHQADDYLYRDINPGARTLNLSAAFLFEGPTAFPKYREYFYGSDAGTDMSAAVGTKVVALEIVRSAVKKVHVDIPEAVLAWSDAPQADPGGDPIEVEVAGEVSKPSGSPVCTIVTSDQTATV